jgi:hypothetical protein
LTHHRHLLEVVQRVCPQVRIHHLVPETTTPQIVVDIEMA